MSVANRSAGRGVHIYNANDPANVLGGLILTNGVTNANFYSMVDIVFVFSQNYFLRDEGGITVQKDDRPLQPGNYYFVTNGRFPSMGYIVKLLIPIGPVTVNDEPWLVRTTSMASGTRIAAFCDAVRERDRRCVVTGKPALRAKHGIWWGFEAAHIFPLAFEGHWAEEDFGRWIAVQPATGSAGPINSVQNGMPLRRDIHTLSMAMIYRSIRMYA